MFDEARGLAVIALVMLALLAGCAMLGAGGKVRVSNQTAGTPICRITGGNTPGSDYRMEHIEPGQAGEVAFSSGRKAVCVYACEGGVGYDRVNTHVMGCQNLPLDGKTPDEIIIFDGPAKPDVPATPGYRQTLSENNVNPVFKENQSKGWLTPYGQPADGLLHVVVEHPGVCSKSVSLEVEDRKGTRRRYAVDPKQATQIDARTPPVWVSFSLNRAKPDFPRVWDLPTGVYRMRVRDDCQGVELVSQKYPEGATGRAQPAGGTAP